MAFAHIATPADFCRVRVGELVVLDVVLVAEPLPTVLLHAGHAADVLQRGSSILGSLFVGHGTGSGISRRGCQQGYLSLEGCNHLAVNLATLQITEGTVILSVVST